MDSPVPEIETPRPGRKNKKGKGKLIDDFGTPPATSGKRKRGMKSMSVTPSINNEDEDDDRDTVRGGYNYLQSQFDVDIFHQKRRKTKASDIPQAVRDKMKKAFNECLKAVVTCEDETGRKRCDMFKELVNKRVRGNIFCPHLCADMLHRNTLITIT